LRVDFDTWIKILTTRKDLKAWTDRPGIWIDRVRESRTPDKLILDLDNSGERSPRSAGRLGVTLGMCRAARAASCTIPLLGHI
jgi:hypothetical protein